MVYVPAGVLLPVVMVICDDPDPFGMEAGLNEAVAPPGKPDALKVTVLLNPPPEDEVTVKALEPPAVTVAEVGLTAGTTK
jgi:hypothetical protein